MRLPRIAVASLLCLALAPAAASAAGNAPMSAKERKVRQLLQLTGAQAVGDQILNSVLQQYDNAPPDQIPKGFTQKFREEAAKDSVVDRMVPIYMANIADDDLDELIKFYNSKAGKDFVKAQPVILQQSLQVGQDWGKQVLCRTMHDLNMQCPDDQPGGAPQK